MISDGGFTARHYITMSLSQLLGDNLLVRWIRGATARHELVVSMTGLGLGDRLLVIGLSEPRVLAALAGKVGITGRACGVDADASAVERAERAAANAGVLVEVAQAEPDRPPYDVDAFDVVVVRSAGTLAPDEETRRAMVGAAAVLRNGGRCLVLAGGGRGRGGGSRGPSIARGAALVALFNAAGYRAARVLAERDGILFVEAVHRH
jgi:SAM-dependent methyltransferase